MKKISFIAIFSLLLLVLHNSCKNYDEEDLKGTYVNNYSEGRVFLPLESPGRIDTLILLENNKYTSQYFRKGTYKVFKMNNSLYLQLIPYDIDKAGFAMIVSSKGLLKKTIILVMDIDNNYYYKKIK